jgi:hypothetical protein
VLPPTGRAIAFVDDRDHLTYTAVKSFLIEGSAVSQVDLGYTPPHQRNAVSEREGLLLIRYRLLGGQTPGLPLRSDFTLLPAVSFDHQIQRSTASVTAWGVEAGRYTATLSNSRGFLSVLTEAVGVARPLIQTVTVTQVFPR